MKKDLIVRVPLTMFDELTETAKRENKPRSYLVREILQIGLDKRKEKANAKSN